MPIPAVKQLFFNFQQKPNFSKEDFILSSGNQEAFLYLARWPNWFSNNYLVYGPDGSGKSYMAEYWKQVSGAVEVNLFTTPKKELDRLLEKHEAFIFDDFDHYFTRKYLLQNLDQHDYNSFDEVFIRILDYLKTENKFIFLTCTAAPEQLNIKTADLSSRISALTKFPLKSPDESALNTMLVKKFSELQIKTDQNIVDLIAKNSGSSFKKAHNIVTLVNESALSEKKNITTSFVKKLIKENLTAETNA